MRLRTQVPSVNWILLTAALISLIISAWIGLRENVINPDGICYVMSAEAIGTMGIKGILHLCPQAQWPLYPAMIYEVVQWSHLSYPLAAYTLNGLFALISVVSFILIVKALGGDRRTLWLAAAVVLMSHDFDSVRQYIVRDHGFWAFYLLSMLHMVRYFKEPRFIDAMLFGVSILIATLFRLEGVVFWALLPFAVWFKTECRVSQRCLHFVALNALAIAGMGALLAWFATHPDQTLAQLGRVAEIPNQLQNGINIIIDRYQHMKTGLETAVLVDDSVREAGQLLGLMLFVWYIASVITSVSWVYVLLIAYAMIYLRKQMQSFIVPYAYLSVNVIITFIFLMERAFLSKRYLIAETLVLMLWVPFALNDLLKNRFQSWKHQAVGYLIAAWMAFSALGGLIDFGYPKTHIRQASTWMEANIPANAQVYVNDFQLMYYSHHFGFELFEKLHEYVRTMTITGGTWKKFDYVVIRLDKHKPLKALALRQEMNMAPVQEFANKRGDQVLIYKVNHTGSN